MQAACVRGWRAADGFAQVEAGVCTAKQVSLPGCMIAQYWQIVVAGEPWYLASSL